MQSNFVLCTFFKLILCFLVRRINRIQQEKGLLCGWDSKKGCVHLLHSLRIQGHRGAFGMYILALNGTGKATPGFVVFFLQIPIPFAISPPSFQTGFQTPYGPDTALLQEFPYNQILSHEDTAKRRKSPNKFQQCQITFSSCIFTWHGNTSKEQLFYNQNFCSLFISFFLLSCSETVRQQASR